MLHEIKPRPFLSLVVIHRRAAKIGDLLRSLIAPLGLLHVDELVLVHTGPDDKDDATRQAREAIRAWLPQSIPIVEAEYRCVDEVEIEGKKYIGDFGRAREFAHGLASGQWTMYLDADDTLDIGPELVERGARLSDWLKECVEEERVLLGMELPCVSLPYVYSREVTHQRVRMWNEDFAWLWRGQLHETRVPADGSKPSPLVVDLDDYPRVVHHGEPSASVKRNDAVLAAVEPHDGTPEMHLAMFAAKGRTGEADVWIGQALVQGNLDVALDIAACATEAYLSDPKMRDSNIEALISSLLDLAWRVRMDQRVWCLLRAAALEAVYAQVTDTIQLTHCAAELLTPEVLPMLFREEQGYTLWGHIRRCFRAEGRYEEDPFGFDFDREHREAAAEGIYALAVDFAQRGDRWGLGQLLGNVPSSVWGQKVRLAYAFLDSMPHFNNAPERLNAYQSIPVLYEGLLPSPEIPDALQVHLKRVPTSSMWHCQLDPRDEREDTGVRAGCRFIPRGCFTYYGPAHRLPALCGQGAKVVYVVPPGSVEGRWAPAYLLADHVIVKGEPDVERFLSLYKGAHLDRARSLVSLNLA